VISKWPRLTAVMLALAGSAVAAASAPFEPFAATYDVVWRGAAAGTSSLELTRESPDTYKYSSQNKARGIFRIALPDTILQSSEFRVGDGRVTPLRYRADDGSESDGRDISLDFDWENRRVTGVAERKPVSLEIGTDTQDPMSVQFWQMQVVADGKSPATYQLVDKTRLKDYEMVRERTEQRLTALGPVETIVAVSRRPGSENLTRVWYAPSLGYVPVYAERIRKKRVEFTMTLRSLKRAGV